jgi:hypothetical protein
MERSSILDDTLGYFLPTGFIILLYSGEDVKVIEQTEEINTYMYTEKGLATLWHEYAHFLQTISTYAGISFLVKWWEVIVKYAATKNSISKINIANFQEKLDTTNEFRIAFSELVELQKVYSYQADLDYIAGAPEEIEQMGLFLEDDKLWMKLVNSYNDAFSLRISNSVFKESMSRSLGDIIERKVNPTEDVYLNSNQVQYYAMRLFVLRFFDDIDINKATITICDACLQSIHPHAILFNIYNALKKAEDKQIIRNLLINGESLALARRYYKHFEDDFEYLKEAIDYNLTLFETPPSKSIAGNLKNLWLFIKMILEKRNTEDVLVKELLSGQGYENYIFMTNKYAHPILVIWDKKIENGTVASFGVGTEFKDVWFYFMAGYQIFRKYFELNDSPCFFYATDACRRIKCKECLDDFINVKVDINGESCFIPDYAKTFGLI